jgi:hypothetical protein
LGYEKPQSAYGRCGVFLRHIWGGVIAAQCPITRPKRRIQPERYAQCFRQTITFFEFNVKTLSQNRKNVILMHFIKIKNYLIHQISYCQVNQYPI